MRRVKWWIAPALVVGALLALAVPSMASPVLFGMEQDGKAVPVGTQITSSSQGVVTVSSTKWSNFFCRSWNIVGTLAANESGTNQTIKKGELEQYVGVTPSFRVTGARGTSGSCETVGRNAPVTNLIVNELKTRQSKYTENGKVGTGTAALSLVITSPVGECKLSSPEVPFTYSRGSSLVTIDSAPLSETSQCGKTSLSGSFLVSANGKPIVLN
jgi:hypothetical protein